MILEEAINKAADWWIAMIRDGRWDNGDASTEIFHSFAKHMAPKPTEEDYASARECLVELLKEERNQHCLYSDYGSPQMDRKFKEKGCKLDSLLHCPQKSGTKIEEVKGDYRVLAKSGYGGQWQKI